MSKFLLLVFQLHGFANNWCQKPKIFSSALGSDSLERFVPGVSSDGKPADMCREQCCCVKVFCGPYGFFGVHMDIGPAFVILPTVERREIKAAKLTTDLGKVWSVTTVATEEEPPRCGLQGKSRPQGLVLLQQPAGVMPCGQQVDFDPRPVFLGERAKVSRTMLLHPRSMPRTSVPRLIF